MSSRCPHGRLKWLKSENPASGQYPLCLFAAHPEPRSQLTCGQADSCQKRGSNVSALMSTAWSTRSSVTTIWIVETKGLEVSINLSINLSMIVQHGPRSSKMVHNVFARSLRGALKIYKDCFQPSPWFAWNLNLSALFPVSCRSESVLRSKVQTLLTGDIPRRGQRTYCGKGLGTWSWPELNKRNCDSAAISANPNIWQKESVAGVKVFWGVGAAGAKTSRVIMVISWKV